jgi:iron(III) transport system ATP-binding protein
MVRISGVSKSYGPVKAVREFSLELEPGRILALLGPSGCGKTTTLRLLAGFEHPEGGEIVIAGKPVAGPGVFIQPEKRKVGMVFQDYALFPHLTVEQNVAYGLPRGKRRNGRVEEVLRIAPDATRALGRSAATGRAGASARTGARRGPTRRAFLQPRRHTAVQS